MKYQAMPAIRRKYKARTLHATGPKPFLNAILSASGTGYDRLVWSTGERTASIVAEEADEYTLTAIANNGCQAETAITINDNRVMPEVSIVATPEPLITTARPSVKLSAIVEAGCTYVWNTGLADKDLEVSGGGIYTVTATNPEGCQAEAEIEVFSTIGVSEAEFHFEVFGSKDRIDVVFDGVCDVQLYTMSGRKMADRRKVLNQTVFRGLDDGMYLVVVNGVPRKVIVR